MAPSQTSGRPPPESHPKPSEPNSLAKLAEERSAEDRRLDEELDETFPASDAVPYRHDR